LAFYIKVTARAREEQPNIILIDEPGLYLHAKAQQDILKKLEESSHDAPIYFSTHSPYLIEADKLERVRLVLKTTKKGTVVENKIHKVSDKDTLTPILTAIGLEMANSVTEVDKVDNIIVEGPSDWYYLQAFKWILDGTSLNFIYGGGSGNMPKVGTILHGWGCNVLYLYDNDQGVKDAEKNLKSEWLTTTKEMLDRIPIPGAAIEDVFSKDDYKKLVLKDDKLVYTESNSEYAKAKKRDKVLDAKLFLESLHLQKTILSKETSDNVQKLFESITKKLASLKKK
jgi:predicted ATP-dependent endonuclease of OLD family